MSSNEWKEVQLKDICEYISRGVTPAYTDKYGVVVLNQKCIRNNRVLYEQSRLTNPEKKRILDEKYLCDYDILVNSTGVGTLGRVAQIKKIVKRTTVDSHVTIVRANESVNSRFLGYNLFLQQSNIEALAEGSTGQTELSKTRLAEAIKVLLPPVLEQIAIADTLSCLDDKIDLNNRINKNLEKIAQAIFKSWFVDFEPFQEGGLEESEVGMIPKGWEIRELGKLVDITNGYSYKGSELKGSEDVMMTIKNFDRNGGIKIDGFKEIEISEKVKDRHYIRMFDVLVACTDLTQNAEIIGNPILVLTKSKYNNLIASMDLVKVVPKASSISSFFLYALMKNQKFKQFALGYTSGTTVLHLNKKAISDYKIALPIDEYILKDFTSTIEPLFKLISNNINENRVLTIARDTLLPKLMSGEIRIPLEEVQ